MGIVKVVTLLLLLSIQYFNIILISTFCFIYIYIYIYICQGSRVRPIWLHVRPNFSRVRLKKI